MKFKNAIKQPKTKNAPAAELNIENVKASGIIVNISPVIVGSIKLISENNEPWDNNSLVAPITLQIRIISKGVNKIFFIFLKTELRSAFFCRSKSSRLFIAIIGMYISIKTFISYIVTCKSKSITVTQDEAINSINIK
jgi:hypothetical protein